MSSALTEYSQTLGQLTDAYGDPTVTSTTIAALNKKLLDTLNKMPDTPEGNKIKAELAATADPAQRQQLIAQAQDMGARAQSNRDATMEMAENALIKELELT